MNPLSVAIGLVAIVFGAYMFYVRAARPEKLAKLGAMRQRFGDQGGTRIHMVAYSLLPIALGILALVLGMSGRSILGW